jgi:hypothetical protein
VAAEAALCRSAQIARPFGRVIPLADADHPLATPGLADGQRRSAALRAPQAPKRRHDESEIHRDRRETPSLARSVLVRRREQIAAVAKSEQPLLFELKDDRRPTADRTAAGRYLEPSLFSTREREG